MLSDKGCTKLCSILKKNLDIFAWQPSDMTGVPRLVAEHRLNIQEGYSPVRQKKRGQAPERAKAIQAEVQKLVEAGIIREVYYHDWLSNLVMVKKHDGSWRMCVDFTNLNKACPHDCYPLPKIDWKVESLYGYPFKCFLDAYKGYHQIQLAETDEEKIAFHTGQGCTATRKCLLASRMLSYTEAEMMRDIEETFRTLRKFNMKLNLKKCSFGLAEGMFLGYVVTSEGIKPCLDKTAAVLQLPSPRTIKETAEEEQAFKQLKQHLSELPLLVAPKPKEELIIYLSATHGAISAVLMTERGAVQTPIYFISCALQGPELNYSPMEKLVLSLVFAAKRLRRYFQAHPITVVIDQPIKQVMSHFLIEMPGENPQAAPVAEIQQEPWTLFMDGSSCVYEFGAGLILTKTEGIEFTYALRFQFAASNNEAEYESLIVGLRIAARMGVKDVHVSVDFKLVANQVLGTYVAKEDNMVKYLEIVKSLVSGFTTFSISAGRNTQRQIYKREEGGNSDRGRLTDLDDTDSGLFKRRNSPRRQKGGKKAPPQGPTIRVNRGNSLQTVVPYAGAKWIEAKAVATITGGQVKKFVWDNIVCHFEIPSEIVSDNGKQFSDNPFKDWCDKLNITQRFASVKHPQSNELVERANRSLGEGIKSCLGEGNKNWVEELPHVLWAHRTMIKSSHGDTPFSLTYGTEAIILLILICSNIQYPNTTKPINKTKYTR
nr:reverse transcriptase domain-containing protein [Tanacetum cinerariifolium]